MRLLFTFGTTALIAGVYLLAQEQTAAPAKPDQDQSGQDQQASATRGMPARATPGDYQTHADAGKVTIAGESAGGMSVCDHLVAPGSAGLFRAAIIQSGPCQAQANLAAAAKTSLDYAAAVGCGNPATAALQRPPLKVNSEPSS